MKNPCVHICAGVLLATARSTALAQQAPTSNSVPVTADNIVRAEFGNAVFTGLVAQGGFGKFYHNREVTSPDSPHRPAPQPRHALFNGCV